MKSFDKLCLRFALAPAALIALLMPAPAGHAQNGKTTISSGYLCCNMRVYDDWISDINYRFDGTAIIPFGTRAWVKGEGRYSFTLAMAGKTRSLGNDYSRSLSGEAFLRRYLVKTSPREKIHTWEPDIQDAVRHMRVMIGMTEEQVLTAIGYPPHNYTPDLKAPVWQYWLDRSSQFDLHWDKQRRLRRIKSDSLTRRKVTWRPRVKPAPVMPAPQSTETHQSLRNSLSFANTVR